MKARKKVIGLDGKSRWVTYYRRAPQKRKTENKKMSKKASKAFNKVLKTVADVVDNPDKYPDKFEIGIDGKIRKVKFCPKCKTQLTAFGWGEKGKRIHSWECPNKKCGYWELTKLGEKSLEPALKDIKEGRTYIMSCSTKTKRSNRCKKSGERLWVCPSCHFKDCDKWYRLGKKDARHEAHKEVLEWLKRRRGAWNYDDMVKGFVKKFGVK
jgi:Zn ribbon nucleic-acid-binding protein